MKDAENFHFSLPQESLNQIICFNDKINKIDIKIEKILTQIEILNRNFEIRINNLEDKNEKNEKSILGIKREAEKFPNLLNTIRLYIPTLLALGAIAGWLFKKYLLLVN